VIVIVRLFAGASADIRRLFREPIHDAPRCQICFGHDDPRSIEIGKSGRLRPVCQAADHRRFSANEIEAAGPSIAAGWSKPTTSGRLAADPLLVARFNQF
jgi:hypothetical protein